MTDGNSNGLLRIYRSVLGSGGAKAVQIPAVGGFDNMAVVIVVAGTVAADGFTSNSFTSAVPVSFNTPSATLSEEPDLVIVGTFNTQGKTFTLPGSLTSRGNPTCLPFAALAVASTTVSSSGASPTYTIGVDGDCKPGVFVVGFAS